MLLALSALIISSCSNSNSEKNSEKPTDSLPSQTMFLKPYFGETEKNYYKPDTIAGHIHQPGVDQEFKWAEHPTGKVVRKTNNMGFKEDADTKVQKDANAFRVLVTGDSHIDGVVYNAESYPNQLEKMLNEKTGEHPVYECINAAAGYYGPQNYLGVLNRFKELKPDIFIVTVYTGNDFLDAIRIESENGKLKVPERKDDYYYDLWAVDEKHPGFTGQLMNQVKFFKKFPEFKTSALSITENYLSLIKNYCDTNHIQLYVVLLPAKVDVEAQTDSARMKEVQKMLALTDDDLKVNQELSSKLAQWLKTTNISYVDLIEKWKVEKKTEELFWKADYHINHNGHRRIAELLLPEILSDKK